MALLVIAFRGSNETVNRIGEACLIAPTELEIGFMVINEPSHGAVMHEAGRFFHFAQRVAYQTQFLLDVSVADIESIRSLPEKIRAHENKVLDLRRQLEAMRALKALPHDSPMQFLGYCAILEALLTHAPKPSDPYESITRQVRKKVALLNNQWPTRLDYAPFASTQAENIWSKMYSYRSQLAHGAEIAFSGDLAALSNHKTAQRLLVDTVKAVMHYGLDEPALLRDLREC